MDLTRSVAAQDAAAAVLGPVGAHKLRSSMTLLALVARDAPLFAQVLDRLLGGDRDPRPLTRLAGS